MPALNANMYNDAFNDFYVVMEQTSPEDNKVQIVKDGSSNGLNFLRFSTCLQSFYGRNRNRRLWKAQQIKTMVNDRPVQELIEKGSFVGEAGHPVPDDGKVTIERILTIDPLRCSHRIISLSWPNENELHGVVETLDEGVGSPGYRFMKNIQQGIIPAFSLRSLVPQRKNADGTTDVIGPGRCVCYDRVYLPSHQEAYMDMEIPVKNIITKSKFETVMESYCDFVTSHSDKIRRIAEDFSPAMESATFDVKSGMVSIPSPEGRMFIAPELKYRREIKSLFDELSI